MKSIEEITNIITPILESYDIQSAYIFGSYARGTARPDSDIDLVVAYNDTMSLFDEGGLFEDLKEALGMDVDLVSFGSVVSDRFKYNILHDMVHIFGVTYKDEQKQKLFA